MLPQRTILRLKGRDTLWIESSLLLKHQVEDNVYHLMGQIRHYLNTKIVVRFIDSLRLLCFDCLYNDSSHNFRVFCILCFTFLNLSNFLQYAFVVCFFSVMALKIALVEFTISVLNEPELIVTTAMPIYFNTLLISLE